MRYTLVILLATFVIPAQAQDDRNVSSPLALSLDGRHELALTVGAFRPTSSFNLRRTGAFGSNDRFGRTGYMFAMDYLRNLNRSVAIGAEWGYISREQQEITNVYNPILPFVTRVRGDTNLVLGIVRLRLPGAGFRPYGLVGAGWFRTRLNVYGAWPSGGPEADFIDDAKTGFAWMMRTGVEYTALSGSFIAVEGGFLRTASKSFGPTDAGLASGFLPVSATGDGMSLAMRVGIRLGPK